jgi:hypothetical protein
MACAASSRLPRYCMQRHVGGPKEDRLKWLQLLRIAHLQAPTEMRLDDIAFPYYRRRLRIPYLPSHGATLDFRHAAR